MYEKIGISDNVVELSKKVEKDVEEVFKQIDEVCEYNTAKVLSAFQKYNISDMHFGSTTGYGYGDVGRDTIEKVFAEVLGAEDCLVRSQFISGSHALTVALFAFLRPGDTMLSICGKPYDTLDKVIGIEENNSSLKSFGVKYEQIDMIDDDFDYEVGGKIKIKVKDLDALRLREDLAEDRKILEELLYQSIDVTPDKDSKLLDLKNHISKKIKNPINISNKKIIIFTSFSDTAEYLYANIHDWLLKEHGLYCGLVTGGSGVRTNLKTVSNQFEEILTHFSPRSNHLDVNKEQIDILIATDCISEGQNLQDCDYLMNYDIHWNPVRIVQRFGRIDRIGSINKVIQLVNFWPNMELDEYINLEHRVKNRMVMLDLSATGDDDLLSAESKNLEYRKNQLKQLQNEVLDVKIYRVVFLLQT